MDRRTAARWAAIVACLGALAAALAACGGSSGGSGSSTTSGGGSSTTGASSKPLTGVKIGFAVPVLANPYWKANVEFAKKMGSELGATVVVADANSQEDVQLKNVQDLIAQGVRGLVFGPVTAAVGPSILKACQDAHIKCAAAARKPGVEPPSSGNGSYVGYVVGNDAGDGAASAAALVRAGARRCVGMSGQEGNSVADDRLKGFQDEMSRAGVKVLSTFRPAELAEDGQRATENFLAQFPGPGFDCLWAFDGDAAIGSISALQKAGVLSKVKVGGLDASAPNVAAIQSGQLLVSSAGGEYINGGLATIMVYDAINGHAPTRRGIVLDGIVVQKSNVDAFKQAYVDQLPTMYDARKLSQTYDPQATSDGLRIVAP